MASLNTVEDIKRYLDLESQDQTISDADIQKFLDDSNDEMFDEMKRTEEIDTFRVGYTEYGETRKVYSLAIGPTETIERVLVNGDALDVADYDLNANGFQVEITASLSLGQKLQIAYKPKIYKKVELYIALMKLRARINPFSEEDRDPVYEEYKMQRDKFLSIITRKLVTGRFM